MDILLTQAAVLHLMTSRRAGAIVLDGPTDLNLWRPPGPEREFAEAYGPQLPDVLDKERRRLEGRPLAIGEMVRLHPGKLHCDFLIWVATRPPHAHTTQAAAPTLDVIFKAVKDALAFAAERNVVRIAFAPLGAGPGEVDTAERLATIVRAAHEYKEECTSAARRLALEEVQVCHPSSAMISQAQRMVQRMAKAARPEVTPSTTSTPPRKPASKTKKPAGTRSTRVTKLSVDEINHARTVAPPYDRTRSYLASQWVIHPTFGVGRIEEVVDAGMINVRFEDGQTRKLIHGR
jgi:O-acetyl-ADP-ribose deacetylase (regulator of RNase III)